MTTVFHVWPYGRFIEIQSNLRRKKLHRTNQGSNFLGGSFSNTDNVRAPIQFKRESQPQHFKRWFIQRDFQTRYSNIFTLKLVKKPFTWNYYYSNSSKTIKPDFYGIFVNLNKILGLKILKIFSLNMLLEHSQKWTPICFKMMVH